MLPEAYLSEPLMELERWLVKEGYPNALAELVEESVRQGRKNAIHTLMKDGRGGVTLVCTWIATPHGWHFWNAIQERISPLPRPEYETN